MNNVWIIRSAAHRKASLFTVSSLSFLFALFCVGNDTNSTVFAAQNDSSNAAASVEKNDDVSRVVLISSHSPDQIAAVDGSGKTLWSLDAKNGVEHPQDAAATDDGIVFFSVLTGAKAVRIADKKELWNYRTPEGTQNPVAQPLDAGYFLVGNEGPCKLLEINASGETRREIKVDDCPFQGSHGQFRFCRKTPEGTYLFPMINAGILREYDVDGRKIREFPISGASVGAVRLPNGDTLTGAGSAVERFDRDEKLIWRFDCVADGGLKPALVTAVSVLKNGNVLFGYYQNDPTTPDVVEISPEKKIVASWTLPDTGLVAAVQLLDLEFKPSKEVVAR